MLTGEDLFEQATEDVSNFNYWAQSEQLTVFVVIQIMSFRDRSIRALKKTANYDNGDYPHYHAKLQKIFNDTDKQFIGQLSVMEVILENQGLIWLIRIEKILKKVQKIAEDRILYNDQEFFKTELRESAHEFLLMFCNVWATIGFPNFAPKFGNEVISLLIKFRNSYRFFEHVREDLFQIMTIREYNPDWLWIKGQFPVEIKIDPGELKIRKLLQKSF